MNGLNRTTPETAALKEILKAVRDRPVEGKKFGELEDYCTAVLKRHISEAAVPVAR